MLMDERLALAYGGYLLWLLAGCVDFACHRRTGLAFTSARRELALHAAQIGLIASGLGLALLLLPGRLLFLLLVLVATLHAWAGYRDTVVAFGARVISPLEQHVHSVLDLAPWIALAGYGLANGPAITAGGWRLEPRDAAAVLAGAVWLGVPALLLVAWPAWREWTDVSAARGARASGH